MKAPDWDSLRDVGAEVRRLKAAGAWDDAAFERLLEKATAAANGQTQYLEFLIRQKPGGAKIELH